MNYRRYLADVTRIGSGQAYAIAAHSLAASGSLLVAAGGLASTPWSLSPFDPDVFADQLLGSGLDVGNALAADVLLVDTLCGHLWNLSIPDSRLNFTPPVIQLPNAFAGATATAISGYIID